MLVIDRNACTKAAHYGETWQTTLKADFSYKTVNSKSLIFYETILF